MSLITKARFMDGLVCWLPMTEGAGTVVKDLSKYGNNGTFGAGAAAPSWASGRDGLPSVDFDGGDTIAIPDVASLRIGTSDFAIIASFKTSNTDEYKGIVAKGWTDASDWMLYQPNSQSVRFYSDGGGLDLLATTVVTDGVWHQAAVVRRGDNAHLYIDALLEQSVSGVDSIDLSTADDLSVGSCKEGADRYWNGLIDSVYIYNRALDPYEIRAAYEGVRRI